MQSVKHWNGQKKLEEREMKGATDHEMLKTEFWARGTQSMIFIMNRVYLKSVHSLKWIVMQRMTI